MHSSTERLSQAQNCGSGSAIQMLSKWPGETGGHGAADAFGKAHSSMSITERNSDDNRAHTAVLLHSRNFKP